MKALEIIRYKLFWVSDFLKGGNISKYYKEIKFISDNYHSKKSVKLREGYLSNLLNHAVTTTPFYKPYQNKISLTDFPVINKSILKNNFENFKSESHKNNYNFKVSTSGSTGTPLKLYQDSNKRYRNIADTIYFAEKAGFKLGTKLIFMRAWTKLNKKNPFVAWIQNIEMQDVVSLSDEELSNFIIRLTNDKNEKGILSYASSLEAVCKYLDKINSGPLDCNLNSIISNSESLNDYTKESIIKYFKTPVVSRYSNVENGIIAQQNLNGGTDFDINWASYNVEILEIDNDAPATLGELGRVVVTDLFNYCMPIIRYDTGDVACIDLNNSKTPVFKRIEGRRLDLVYNTKGELMSSFIIGILMSKYSALKQYQFIQESKTNYLFKLNAEKEFKNETQLIEEFKKVIGDDSIIKIEYVDEIPALASGKRRQVVNNYIKD